MTKRVNEDQSSVNQQIQNESQATQAYNLYVELQANYHHMVHVLKRARGNDVMVTPFPKFSDFRWLLKNQVERFPVKQFLYVTGTAKVDAVYDYWFTIPKEVSSKYGNSQSNIDETKSGNRESEQS